MKGAFSLLGRLGFPSRLADYLSSGGGPRLAVFALLVAMALWGSVFVATERAMEGAGPFTVAAARFAIGLAALLPFAYRDGFRFRLVVRPEFLQFGFFGVFLSYGLQNLALLYTSASSAALIMAGMPAAVALMAVLFLRERMPPPRLAGVGVSVAGVALVSGAVPDGGGSGAIMGHVLMAASVLAYAAYAVQGRTLAAGQPPGLITAAGFGAGLLFFLPFVAGEIYLRGMPELGGEGWLVLLYLGVGATGATFLLFNHALRHLEAGAAGLYFNLVPVAGLGFALLLGEHVGLAELAGGALAVAGVLLGDYVVRRGARHRSAEEAWGEASS
jgi:drug/metabolite transporter (DMT)-like permease